jgi:hypothetical protein
LVFIPVWVENQKARQIKQLSCFLPAPCPFNPATVRRHAHSVYTVNDKAVATDCTVYKKLSRKSRNR